MSHAIFKAKLVSKSKMTTNFKLFKADPKAYFATFPRQLKPSKLNKKSKNSRTKDESASDIFRMPANMWQYLDEQEYWEQTPIKVKTSEPQFRSQEEALLERFSQQNEQTRRIRSGSINSTNSISSTITM